MMTFELPSPSTCKNAGTAVRTRDAVSKVSLTFVKRSADSAAGLPIIHGQDRGVIGGPEESTLAHAGSIQFTHRAIARLMTRSATIDPAALFVFEWPAILPVAYHM